MDVSVVIPTLNEEEDIKKCLKAISSQNTESSFEVILADGGSKDKTVSIAERYADKIVEVRKKGISAGRNKGARAAKGELLVFIDGDTVIPPNYLRTVESVMENGKIKGLSCAFRFDERRKSLEMIEILSNHYLIMKGMSGKGELLGFNNVIRKKDFSRVRGFPSKPLEDGAMARKLHKTGRVIYLPEPSVVTSARRMKKGGTMKAVEYYANLSLATYYPNRLFKKLLKYQKYLPVR